MEQVVRVNCKAVSADGKLDFVLSDATIDRYGDTIDPNGWDVRDFKHNPIALFNHNNDFPIGKWKNIRVEDKALRGELQLAPQGASARIDELRALIDAGILRAVSVGFMPVESFPRKDAAGHYIGMNFTKQTLLETSLVSVPANPSAVLTAKGMNISKDTIDLVFAKHGNEEQFVVWGGKRVPVQRYEQGSWRGQKQFRY